MKNSSSYAIRYMIKRYNDTNDVWEYSKGGYDPIFVEKGEGGKVWPSIGALKNHLNLIMEVYSAIPSTWVVVPIFIIEQEDKKVPAHAFYSDFYISKQKEKERQELKQRKEYLLKRKKEIEDELKELT